MFWKFDVHTTSQVDTLLEKEDVTLVELLDEDDILQECKAQNKKLIDFLVRTDIMDELVGLITKEPSGDMEEQLQYRHPNMACELLTSDVGAISDKLADTESAMTALWAFLNPQPPLNPLLASFFSKTIGTLLVRRPEVVIDHLKSKDNSIGIILNHLGTSAIMDLLLRLITCIESREVRQEFLEWLNEQKFIQRLVDLIDPEEADDKHSNAAQTLCDIVRITREHMSQLQECAENDPLLATLEKQETVAELLEHMFHGKKSKSALVNGVSVLLALLEFKKQGPEGQEQMTALDAERLAHGVSGTLKAVIPQLTELHQLLTDPPEQAPMPTTVGKLAPPFGAVRLQVCKLIAALLVTNTQSINTELSKLGTIKSLWELLFQYLWNNFLHLEVEKSISTILTNNPTESEEGKTQHPLLVHLFTDCKLIQRILDTWEENDQSQQKGGSRRGYMGHLTRITNTVIHEMEKGCNCEQIKSLFQEYVPEDYREKWNLFLVGSLSELNKRNTVDLVGTHPLHSSSEDDDGDFGNIDFGKDTAVQQAFSDYQMQQMTSHFIDQFGFSEEDFTKQEDNVNNPFDTISDISFSISANEDNPNSALFEACCNERISKFNDNNSDEEDMWEEKELTFSSNVDDSRTCDSTAALAGGSDNDSDSDEEHTKEEIPRSPQPSPSISEETKMDVDSGDTWTANFDDVPMDGSVAMDTTPTAWAESSPQAGSTQDEESETGWANFSDFNAGFNAVSPEGPRSSSPVAMDSESSLDEVTGQEEATSSEATPLYPAQPGAAYVVSSSPKKLSTENSHNTVVTSSIGTTTQLGNGAEEREMVVEASSAQVEKPTPSSPAAPVSTLHNSLPACPPSSPPTSPQPDSTVADPQSVSSPDAKLTNSTTSTEEQQQQENSNEMSSSSDTLSSKKSNVPLGVASPSSPNNSVDESRLKEVGSESPKGEERTNAVETQQKPVSTVIEVVDGHGSQSQGDEDLDDNFDFLASSGLMKAGPDLSPKPNGPTETERIEKARAEATAALNQFAAATKQNGPV
ncbi:serine/threonine-protein phosphatase 6 regulatory subunit 3-like isoform X2 [Asterias amurensis]|uniref:serine/threonine-protein phosphatase 6 regulatory subunit 3-like isoform X2 n=1 Tax=Asterias amurensis TaxID=7602 RepID=UPI003AB230D2